MKYYQCRLSDTCKGCKDKDLDHTKPHGMRQCHLMACPNGGICIPVKKMKKNKHRT